MNHQERSDWARTVRMDGGGLTPDQARVAFHQERLLYGQPKAHELYINVCASLELPVRVGRMNEVQAITALIAISLVAQCFPVIGRHYDTGWRLIASRLHLTTYDCAAIMARVANRIKELT